MFCKSIDAGINNQRFSTFTLNPEELVMINELTILNCPQFLPDRINAGSRRRPDQPGDTAVEGIPLAFPGCTKPTRLIMLLKDASAIPVHLTITTRGKSGDSCANDNDRFFHMLTLLQLLVNQFNNRLRSARRPVCTLIFYKNPIRFSEPVGGTPKFRHPAG